MAITGHNEDPVVRSARREAAIVFAVWICAMSYTLWYCSGHAYDRWLEDMQFVLGFPDWVFWGIVTPWMACVLFSWAFSYLIMQDADLGEDPDAAPLPREDEHA